MIETSEGPDGRATARYDPAGRYRFSLSRVWDTALPRCVFVMLNPSTATALTGDNTVRRTLRFAASWGFGAVEVVNIFALRATRPQALYEHPDPVGPGNDAAILVAAARGDLIIAGWGMHGALHGRGRRVRSLLNEAGVELATLKLTRDGHPGHPLYLPGTAEPTTWHGTG